MAETVTGLEGAIFDVDDTLLDNIPTTLENALHELSRLQAVHEAGETHDIAGLRAVTPKENLDAFLTAPVHTLEAAVWNILTATGVVTGEYDAKHPLLLEICHRKNELHTDILLEKGAEVPGASQFVRKMSMRVGGRLAIASTAVRKDIDVFLHKFELEPYFLPERIKSKADITHPKPHPEVYNLAFSSLSLPESARRHVVAFEDHPRGIMSAKAAGLFVAGITTRFFDRAALSEVEPDVIADSFAEFEEIFGLTTTT